MTRPWLVSITSVFCALTGRQSAALGPAGAAVAEAAASAAARTALAALLRSMSELGEQALLDAGRHEGGDVAAHLGDLLDVTRGDGLVDRVGHQENRLQLAVHLLVHRRLLKLVLVI